MDQLQISEEKLWSVWERSQTARKHDKLFGKSETKDGSGNIVAKFWWIGRFAFGWYTPFNLEQAGEALDQAKAIVAERTNTMTQRFPEK